MLTCDVERGEWRIDREVLFFTGYPNQWIPIEITQIETGWLEHGENVDRPTGRMAGCQSTNHTAYYGELWQCSACNKVVCTDNHPELYDDCWAKRYEPTIVPACGCSEKECGAWLELTPDGILALEDQDADFRGTNPGGAGSWQVRQALAFTLATAPLTDAAVTTLGAFGYLLIAPRRMFVRTSDDPRSLCFALGCFVSIHQVTHFDKFLLRKCDEV